MAITESAPFLQAAADRARSAGVFGDVEIRGGSLVCPADGSAEPAEYALYTENGRLFVSLTMKDRWQSESIEADLMHSGDKLEELLDEELAEQGYEFEGDSGPTYQHYRSDDMLFTFRSVVPVDGAGEKRAAEIAAAWLLAYEACFRQLGDMDDDGE